MNRSFNARFAALAALVFVASTVAGAWMVGSQSEPTVTEAGFHASWIRDADTVAELSRESDLIVRVQTLDRRPPRALWQPVPGRTANADGTARFLFTDTQVEVLEVYAGKVEIGDRLWVLQTGGEAIDGRGELSRTEVAEDPLYELGNEMVLFLVDISNDPVHAPNAQLFRTVNPAGRFEVAGGRVASAPIGHAAERPGDLDTLEREIRDTL